MSAHSLISPDDSSSSLFITAASPTILDTSETEGNVSSGIGSTESHCSFSKDSRQATEEDMEVCDILDSSVNEYDTQLASGDYIISEIHMYPISNDSIMAQNGTSTGDESELPKTVTVLTTADGIRVFLIGTAHFSKESQEDVAKTIRLVQPNVVMVELCRGRVNILQLDENTILEEAKNINFDKIKYTIRQNGLIQGILHILLLTMSAHLTKELGMAPGGEFRRAFTEARKVPGCMVQLGDRPYQVTLRRALAALSWWQKVRLAWHIMTCREPISKEDVERCKQRDLLEEMLAEMTGEFPAVSEVFVSERDIFLTHSLQSAANSTNHFDGEYNPFTVVGVVGMGHVPGIVEHWGKVCDADIPPLLRVPPPSLIGRVVKGTIKVSFIGLMVLGAVKVVRLSSHIPFNRVFPITVFQSK